MTPAQLIVDHCRRTLDACPEAQRATLLRSLACEISDTELAEACRVLAADLERAARSKRQLTRQTHVRRALA